LTVAELRAAADTEPVRAAVFSFLSGYEPDLLACAEAIGMPPDQLAALAAADTRTEDMT
jgi:hypothetical protein